MNDFTAPSNTQNNTSSNNFSGNQPSGFNQSNGFGNQVGTGSQSGDQGGVQNNYQTNLANQSQSNFANNSNAGSFVDNSVTNSNSGLNHGQDLNANQPQKSQTVAGQQNPNQPSQNNNQNFQQQTTQNSQNRLTQDFQNQTGHNQTQEEKSFTQSNASLNNQPNAGLQHKGQMLDNSQQYQQPQTQYQHREHNQTQSQPQQQIQPGSQGQSGLQQKPQSVSQTQTSQQNTTQPVVELEKKNSDAPVPQTQNLPGQTQQTEPKDETYDFQASDIDGNDKTDFSVDELVNSMETTPVDSDEFTQNGMTNEKFGKTQQVSTGTQDIGNDLQKANISSTVTSEVGSMNSELKVVNDPSDAVEILPNDKQINGSTSSYTQKDGADWGAVSEGNMQKNQLKISAETDVSNNKQSQEPVIKGNQDIDTKPLTDEVNSTQSGNSLPTAKENLEQKPEQKDKSLWEEAEIEATVYTGAVDSSNDGVENNKQPVNSQPTTNKGESKLNAKPNVEVSKNSQNNQNNLPNNENEKKGDKEKAEIMNKQTLKVSVYAFLIGLLVVGTYFVLFVADKKENRKIIHEAPKATKISNLAKTVEQAPKVLPAETEREVKSKVKYTKKEVQDGTSKYSFDAGFSILIPSGWTSCDIDYFASEDTSLALYESRKCPPKADRMGINKIEKSIKDTEDSGINEKSTAGGKDKKVNSTETKGDSDKLIMIISVSDKPLRYLAETSSDQIALSKMPDYVALDVDFSRYLSQNSNTGEEYVILSKKLPNGEFVRISIPTDVELADMEEVLSTFTVEDGSVIDNPEE